jgi:DNA invertase Pin-like site-specific DNA recombinase
MKAVIYARYSSDNQREESIEGQLRDCQAFAERNDMMILGTYIDRAFSAKTDNRPEFQRMIKDSAKGLFEVVLVWKLDRFARNRYDSAHNKAILRKNGVKVVSAMEPISDDSTGILLESLLEGYAEFFSAELAEKVKRGMNENALKCKWNGGGIPIGYTIDDEHHYQVDPLNAPFVVETFQRYADGATLTEIVRWLNDCGVKNYRGFAVGIDTVNRMLRNRSYIGEYHYDTHVIPGGVPAIVPDALFEQMQERLTKNRKAPAHKKAEEEYLLTTKLFCGRCGAFMVGESGASGTGKVHRYYKCAVAKRGGECRKKTVRKAWIEYLVVKQAVKAINNDKTLERVADLVMILQKSENTTLPLLQKQLADAERSIENMLDAIQQGVFTASTKSRLEKLEEAKSELEVKILQEQMEKPLLTKEQILFWLHKFRGIDTPSEEQRKRLIDTFVNAVYVYDDRLVLTFNYQDGTESVTISDIESALGSDLTASAVRRAAADTA